MADTAGQLLRELILHLQHDADLNQDRFNVHRVGCLNLSMEEGALWRRLVEWCGGVPEMQRDVIIPAITQCKGAKADDTDPRVDESSGYLGGGSV